MSKERELLEKVLLTFSEDALNQLCCEIRDLLAQPEQGLQEAFRAGIMYSAKKYRHATVARECFTGNDVALFLEMEACELSGDDITKLLDLDNE